MTINGGGSSTAASTRSPGCRARAARNSLSGNLGLATRLGRTLELRVDYGLRNAGTETRHVAGIGLGF